MKRPKPTKQLILDVTGENQALISSLHHGLYETSLRNFYSVLDFDELVAFAASSWKARERRTLSPHLLVPNEDVYNLFSTVYQIGFPWLNKHKYLSSEAIRKKHKKMNPFQKRDLEDRLHQVSPEAVQHLKRQLQEPVNEYVFECQYHQRKAARGGDNHRLEIMTFQNVYPKRGKIVPAYASEISRMVSRYTQEHEQINQPQPKKQQKKLKN